jgi:hypothetical protein
MALQNGAAGRDLTMATKRFRQAVFKTTFKKNKHMVSPVALPHVPDSDCSPVPLLSCRPSSDNALTIC